MHQLHINTKCTETTRSWVYIPGEASTDQIWTLNAMQVALDKSVCQMHECKYNNWKFWLGNKPRNTQKSKHNVETSYSSFMSTNEKKGKEKVNLIQVSEVNWLNSHATFACSISMQKKNNNSAIHFHLIQNV